MISRSVSCSWCHHINCLDNPEQVFCAKCFHRADRPRSACDCPSCSATPEQRREQAQRDLTEFILKLQANGGDIRKVLDSDTPKRAEERRLDVLAMQYLTAIEHGDFDIIDALYKQAETDEPLWKMILELNEELAKEQDAQGEQPR